MTLKELILQINDAIRSWVGGRSIDEVNERTCYFYRNQGLLDPPLQAGPMAKYGSRHLHQLLAIKALQKGGKSLEEIKLALKGRTDADLAALLPSIPAVSSPAARNGIDQKVSHPFEEKELLLNDLPVTPLPANPWAFHPLAPGYALVCTPGAAPLSPEILAKIQTLLKNYVA